MLGEVLDELTVFGAWVFAQDDEGGLLKHGSGVRSGEPFAGGFGGLGLVDSCQNVERTEAVGVAVGKACDHPFAAFDEFVSRNGLGLLLIQSQQGHQ